MFFRSFMRKKKKPWRSYRTMILGNSSKNKSWSSKHFWRSSERKRHSSKLTKWTSGMIWRNVTPKKRGSYLVPKHLPIVGPPSPTCGTTGVTTLHNTAVETVLGPPHQHPTLLHPLLPGQSRTHGLHPMVIKKKTRIQCPPTGTPNIQIVWTVLLWLI